MDRRVAASLVTVRDAPLAGSEGAGVAAHASPALGRAERACLALGVIVAHLFLLHEWRYPSSYDAGLYANMGREIARHGLFQPFVAADLRTYGYPLFLRFAHRAADAAGVPFVVVVFEAQLLLFVAACLFFRDALRRM